MGRRILLLTAATGALVWFAGTVPQTAPRSTGLITTDGFAVWESNRSGAWRLWIQNLDGTGLRRLTPDEKRRIHCCPHVSPDGQWLAYASFPESADTYRNPAATGELRLIRPSGEAGPIVGPARTYGEHRAAVWRDSSSIIFIDGAGYTALYDLVSRKTERLTLSAADRQGWLIDPTLSTATTGTPAFAAYDRIRRVFVPGRGLGGCQPYFSQDGSWGFWTAGAGGPIDRIRLATGEVSTIVEKNDSRLPKGFDYLYFPMFSRDGGLFLFGASRGEHDHWHSDYEIFLAESDPRTMEIIGPVVQITDDPATDRFPDAWQAPLELGRHFVEAPHTMHLDAGSDLAWEWDFGDGTRGRGRVVEHTYAAAGAYEVVARAAESKKKGRMVVSAAAPPRVIGVSVREAHGILVGFDEPVQTAGARVEFESGRRAASVEVGRDGRTLVVGLASAIQSDDRIRISGLADRAQRPNLIQPAWVDVHPPAWPVDPASAVVSWAGPARSSVRGGGSVNLVPGGRAWVGRDSMMVLRGGWFSVPAEAAGAIVESCRAANRASIEMLVSAAPANQPGVLLALSSGPRERDLLLELRPRGSGATLVCQIGNERAPLVPLPSGPLVHIMLTYTPGVLRLYVDGKLAMESSQIVGDFNHWRARPFTLGAEGRTGGWNGEIGFVAVYDRVLSPEEVQEADRRARAAVAAYPRAEPLIVEAEVVARSAVPSLDRITPYREALVVDEYRVRKVISGSYRLPAIRVVRWGILDNLTLAQPPGARRLTLEPFDRQPQLQSYYISDSLPENYDALLFFDVGWPPFEAVR